MRTRTTKLAAVGAVAALAFAGAACEASDDGGTSPGQEAPAEDGIVDPGTGTEDLGTTDDGAGLDDGTGTEDSGA